MDYLEIAPADALRPWIRCYWVLVGEGEGDRQGGDPALPDGSPELIFNFADPFQAFSGAAAPSLQPDLFLVGQITAPFLVAPTGRVDLVAVRFAPHGATALCDDLAAITDRWLEGPVFESRGLRELHSALGAAASTEHRVLLLNERLSSILSQGRKADPRVVSSVDAIRTGRGAVALGALAGAQGTTPRTLQRLFASDVGVPPKLLARITRFQYVFQGWREDPRSLARVAAECGYFDQSHLIRDFRDFAGEAPARFLAEQPEFTAFFLSGKSPGISGASR